MHKCFLEFLQEVGLGACLSSDSAQGSPITADTLREHGEKLASAVALKDVHSSLEPLTSHRWVRGERWVVVKG